MKKQTNLMIEEEIFKEFKKLCIDRDIDASSQTEELMKKEIENKN